MEQRLQKIISSAGVTSRRASEDLIRSGRVAVNGIVASIGQSADPDLDVISIDGVRLKISCDNTYIMLNKPRGFVTTLMDEKERPTVADLVSDLGKRVYPVGRLDMDSDGLLLLTDDGTLANGLMHPRHEINKTYLTEVSGNIERALPILSAPMIIDGYLIRTPEVRAISDNLLLIQIHEGRNRQIRKMCAQAGLVVKKLTRVEEGPLKLGSLKVGEWRYLTENEISDLKKCVT